MNSKNLNPALIRSAIIAIFSIFAFSTANAQYSTTVASSNGYNVHVTLDVVRIIAPNSCRWGYTFNTRISYDVTFSGSNIPNKLYTLQTTLSCGSYANFTSLPLGGGNGQRNTHSNPWNPNTDCSTATPASLGCNGFTLFIQGPGIPFQTVTMTSITALPISLINYTGNTDGSKVNILWQTASEINNSHFTIEHSTDGISWSNIAKVDAVKEQSGVNNYSITDSKAAEGINYYRLTQYDLDGKKTVYNNILAIHHESAIKFTVFPNPASTQFSVEGDNMESATVSIIDAMGKSINISGEINGNTMTFNTESMTNGIYFVNVTVNDEVKSYKLTVSK